MVAARVVVRRRGLLLFPWIVMAAERARELRGREGACGAQRREPRQRGVGRRRVARGRSAPSTSRRRGGDRALLAARPAVRQVAQGRVALVGAVANKHGSRAAA